MKNMIPDANLATVPIPKQIMPFRGQETIQMQNLGKMIGVFIVILALIAFVVVLFAIIHSRAYKKDVLGALVDGWEVFSFIGALFLVGLVYLVRG